MRNMLATAALGLLLTGEAHAGPLDVVARDAGDGRALSVVCCAVVDAGRNPRWAFRGASYRGPEAVRANDRLLVYCEGYDLGTATLSAGQAEANLSLTRATRFATLRRASPEGAPIPVSLGVRVAGRWPSPPLAPPVREVRLDDAPVRVALPDGFHVEAFVQASAEGGDLVWPRFARLAPDRELVLHRDGPRRIGLRWAETDVEAATRVRAACLPDLLWQPREPGPRVDAWRARINRPAWLRAPLVARAATLDVLPDVPFHAFALVDDVPVYRHVRRDTAEIDLRDPRAGLRAVSNRPVVGGAPLREGAALIPGRLDLLAAATVVDRRDALGAFSVLAPAEDEPWPLVRLPASDWLTAWDRERGIAHLRWRGDVCDPGDFASGRLDVVVDGRCRASGSVMVYPMWRGADTLVATPPDGLLRRPLDPESGQLLIRGLPPGCYAVRLRIAVVDRRTGEAVRTRTHHVVEIDDSRRLGRATVRIP